MNPIGRFLLRLCVIDVDLWPGGPPLSPRILLLCAVSTVAAASASAVGFVRLLLPSVAWPVIALLGPGWFALILNQLRFIFANAPVSPVSATPVAVGGGQPDEAPPRSRFQRLAVVGACVFLGAVSSPLIASAILGPSWLINRLAQRAPVAVPSISAPAIAVTAPKTPAARSRQSPARSPSRSPRRVLPSDSGSTPRRASESPSIRDTGSSVGLGLAIFALFSGSSLLFGVSGWLRTHPALWHHDWRTGVRDRFLVLQQYAEFLRDHEAAILRARSDPVRARMALSAIGSAWVDPPFNTTLRAARAATRTRGSIEEILPADNPSPHVSGLFSVVYETDDIRGSNRSSLATPIRRVMRADIVAGRIVPNAEIDEVIPNNSIRFARLSDVSFTPVGGEMLTPYRETMVDVVIERPVVEVLRMNGRRIVARLEGWGTAQLRPVDL